MAGLDGIQNKICPTAAGFGPFDINIYDMPKEEQAKLGNLPSNMEEALQALKDDCQFLLKGNVFTEELINNWVNYKINKEVIPSKLQPTPLEYEMYYDL